MLFKKADLKSLAEDSGAKPSKNIVAYRNQSYGHYSPLGVLCSSSLQDKNFRVHLGSDERADLATVESACETNAKAQDSQ